MYFHYGSLKTISKNHIYHIRYLGLLYAILTLALSFSLQSLSNHSPTICCIVNYIEQVQGLTICLFLCCCYFTKSSLTCAWLSYTLTLHLCIVDVSKVDIVFLSIFSKQMILVIFLVQIQPNTTVLCVRVRVCGCACVFTISLQYIQMFAIFTYK